MIGVQARSNSARLPDKIHLKIDGKTVLQHVVDNCQDAADFLNRNQNKFDCHVCLNVLVPYGDKVEREFKCRNGQRIMAWPDLDENDVLSRYVRAARLEQADFIVRVTADCVLLPSFLISRHIKTALIRGCDYTSNVAIRTFMEGMDCEVLSIGLLDLMDRTIKGSGREHIANGVVAAQFYRKFTKCHIFENLDLSKFKTSIDTEEDYQQAKALLESLREKKLEAERYGEEIA